MIRLSQEVIENTKSNVTRDVELPSSDLSTQIRGSIDNVGSHVDAAEEKIQTMDDPSAGSPTETLLRLHFSLNDKV
jgi:hypothetical protein